MFKKKKSLGPRSAQEIQRNKEVFSPTFGIHAFPLPGHKGLSMVDSEEKLEAVKEFCHLSEILSAEASCELSVPTL